MARHSSAVAAAELQVGQSRRALRDSLRRLRGAIPALPALLAAVGVAGALAGLWLMRRAARR